MSRFLSAVKLSIFRTRRERANAGRNNRLPESGRGRTRRRRLNFRRRLNRRRRGAIRERLAYAMLGIQIHRVRAGARRPRTPALVLYKGLVPVPVKSGHNITDRSMPRRPNGFRFNARYLLLTYAQVPPDWPWGEAVSHLRELQPGARVRMGRENHADGGIHYHCFVDFGQPFDTSEQRRFDAAGHHPNILPVRRTPQSALEYSSKDGDVVADDFGADCDLDPRGSAKRARDAIWREITLAPTRDEFFAKLQEMVPRDLVVSFGSIDKYANWKYSPPVITPYVAPVGCHFEWDTYPVVEEWRRKWIGRTDGRR